MNSESFIEFLLRFQNFDALAFGANNYAVILTVLSIITVGLTLYSRLFRGNIGIQAIIAPNRSSKIWWLLTLPILIGGALFLAGTVFKPIPLDAGLEPPKPQTSNFAQNFWPQGDPKILFPNDKPKLLNVQKLTCNKIQDFYDQDFQCTTEQGLNKSDILVGKIVNPTNLIVFVHGWQGDETTWKQLPEFIRSDQRFVNFAVVNEPYQQFIIRRNAKIYQIAQTLRDRWSRYAKLNGIKNVYFVSHSMGGVIVRDIQLLNDLSPETAMPIAGHISLSSPYGGSPVGSIASYFGITKRLLQDLAIGSSFLEKQQLQWTHRDPKGTWEYCIGSHGDSIVSVQSAQQGCKRNGPLWQSYGHKEIVKPEKIGDQRYSTIAETILLNGEF